MNTKQTDTRIEHLQDELIALRTRIWATYTELTDIITSISHLRHTLYNKES